MKTIHYKRLRKNKKKAKEKKEKTTYIAISKYTFIYSIFIYLFVCLFKVMSPQPG